ncbi:MAG: hypothetical protein Q9168_005726 [Polycauliona sp. 1 TL-2023]
MGGFLAPDPTNAFVGCMDAFAFIRPSPKGSTGVQKPRHHFRRNKPAAEVSDPVAPGPSPPSRTDLENAGAQPKQTGSLRHTDPVIQPPKGRRKLCKKPPVKRTANSAPVLVASVNNATPLDSGHLTPPPLPPRRMIKVDPEQHAVLQNEDIVAASPLVSVLPVTGASSVIVTSPAQLTTPPVVSQEKIPLPEAHTRLESVDIGNAASQPLQDLAALRPRLPHQRMHYIRRLGDGGEGYTDLFRLHCAPQTLLAVKTLRRTPDLISHKNNKRKPLEAHILEDFLPAPHPHIVQMLGYTCTPRKTVLIYEYCSLGDLQDVLENYHSRSANIPESFIWHVYLAIAKALAYLHTGYIAQSCLQNIDADSLALLQTYDQPWTPILHRDIKPENIFLRPSSSSPYPTPLLADFGLATPRIPRPSDCSATYGAEADGEEYAELGVGSEE